MGATLARLGGDGRATENRVFTAYRNAAGSLLNARTEPESVRGQTLFVRASSSAVAHQLALLKAEILGRMGTEEVNDLRTRVGPLQAKAPHGDR